MCVHVRYVIAVVSSIATKRLDDYISPLEMDVFLDTV